MNSNVALLIVFVCMVSACKKKETASHEHASTEPTAQVPADTIKKSISKEEHALLYENHFTIKYHAPAVRGRTIWGGLVPYGEVWVTGAHSATSVEFNKDITINATQVPAGKYAFFTIPGKEKWTIILNKNWDQHLADDYDTKDDIVRVEVAAESFEALQERLKYSILNKGNSEGSIDVRWEKLKISLPIKF